jgi:hypothetical protein
MGVGLGLGLGFSPPFALLTLAIIAGWWTWDRGRAARTRAWTAVVLVALGVLALMLTARAWAALSGGPQGGMLEVLRWWLESGARYQLHILERESGWVQKIFGMIPEWSQLPLATAYGLVQPFLPAALMDSTSKPLVRVIVSARGLGWFLMLPLLLYSSVASLRSQGWRSSAAFLALAVWVTAVLVSYRDAGRMWDNPRWRSVFLAAQAALAGWGWVHARREGDPWLKRTALLVGLVTLAFLGWEAGRYYQLPRLNLWETLMASGALGALLVAWWLIADWRRASKGRD